MSTLLPAKSSSAFGNAVQKLINKAPTSEAIRAGMRAEFQKMTASDKALALNITRLVRYSVNVYTAGETREVFNPSQPITRKGRIAQFLIPWWYMSFTALKEKPGFLPTLGAMLIPRQFTAFRVLKKLHDKPSVKAKLAAFFVPNLSILCNAQKIKTARAYTNGFEKLEKPVKADPS